MDKGLTLKERSGVQETATNDIIAAIAAAAILLFIFNLIVTNRKGSTYSVNNQICIGLFTSFARYGQHKRGLYQPAPSKIYGMQLQACRFSCNRGQSTADDSIIDTVMRISLSFLEEIHLKI